MKRHHTLDSPDRFITKDVVLVVSKTQMDAELLHQPSDSLVLFTTGGGPAGDCCAVLVPSGLLAPADIHQ